MQLTHVYTDIYFEYSRNKRDMLTIDINFVNYYLFLIILQLFLEEEKENEQEKKLEESIVKDANLSRKNNKNEDGEFDSNMILNITSQSLKAGERIMEAIDFIKQVKIIIF